MPETVETDARDDSARSFTLAVYVLQIAGIAAGITAIAGVIINYIKRDDVRGTVYKSHFNWQIRTFWWALLWFIVGTATIELLGLGILVLIVAGIWYLYRIVRGMIAWSRNRPVEA